MHARSSKFSRSLVRLDSCRYVKGHVDETGFSNSGEKIYYFF